MWHVYDQVETSAGRVACGSAGDGLPLVLAHGWPWSSVSWHRIIPKLSQHYRLHWYDMPGFGASDLVPLRKPHLGTQGEIFGEMLDHWGLKRPFVLAHDFGGAVTLRAHLLQGRDFAGWTLMNVVAMRPWGSAFFEHVGKHIPAFTGLPPHIHEAVVRAYINGAFVRDLAIDDVERLVRPWLSEEGKAAFYAQFALADEIYTAEVEPDFPNLRCPTSVLWGTDDPWIPLERGAALAQAIGVPLTPLQGLGHLPQLEDPDQVSVAVLNSFDQSAR